MDGQSVLADDLPAMAGLSTVASSAKAAGDLLTHQGLLGGVTGRRPGNCYKWLFSKSVTVYSRSFTGLCD